VEWIEDARFDRRLAVSAFARCSFGRRRWFAVTGDRRVPPRWLYSVLSVAGLVACGIYLGMMRVEGPSTGHVVRAVAFGVVGLAMFWGATGKR
jgi:hypothetical protein